MWPSTRPRSADALAPGLIDAHCHIDFPFFDGNREQVLADCGQAGIQKLVVPGTVPEGWQVILELARSVSMLAPGVGLHPWWAARFGDDTLMELERLLQLNSRVVAVGECGLDLKQGAPLLQQQRIFEAQIELAERHRQPLLIHSVGTHDTVLSILRKHRFTLPFLMHGFSGSPEQAQALVSQGAFIGVSGVITHSRARKTRRVMARLPLEALVLETDAPGLPPEGVPRDGNSPLNLPRILEALCDLREEHRDRVAEALWVNTQRLFRHRLGA